MKITNLAKIRNQQAKKNKSLTQKREGSPQIEGK